MVAAAAEGHDFAALVAHELRTPLATQRALLELALADERTDASSWRDIGVDVLHACKQQERVLDACLTLARGRYAVALREPVDLASLAGDNLRAHDRRSLTTIATLEPARTNGDPRLLERLVANLVSNAIRHNCPRGRIELATRTDAGRAVLLVSNSGPTIEPATIPRLFEPFSADPVAGGVGLGLTVVRAVADAHDASLAARARRGGGLEIEVSFPASD